MNRRTAPLTSNYERDTIVKMRLAPLTFPNPYQHPTPGSMLMTTLDVIQLRF